MERTVPILRSDEVLAMLGNSENFFKGKWQNVSIIKVGKKIKVGWHRGIPLNVRKSLVGLTIPTIFSKEQLESQGIELPIRDNSRLAYTSDVIHVLNDAGKYKEARQLEKVNPNFFDMYLVDEEMYDLV